jgi:hypothetical protein
VVGELDVDQMDEMDELADQIASRSGTEPEFIVVHNIKDATDLKMRDKFAESETMQNLLDNETCCDLF